MECKKILIGKKIGMMSHIDEGGNVLPVTVVELINTQILEIKTQTLRE